MTSGTGLAFVVRDVCPACAEPSQQTVADLPYAEPPLAEYLLEAYGRTSGSAMLDELGDLRYTLLDCARCGMIWQRSAPSDDLVGRLYESWIDPAASLSIDAGAGLDHRVRLAQELMHVVTATGRPPGELRVLDFGMGWGRWLLMARGLRSPAGR